MSYICNQTIDFAVGMCVCIGLTLAAFSLVIIIVEGFLC